MNATGAVRLQVVDDSAGSGRSIALTPTGRQGARVAHSHKGTRANKKFDVFHSRIVSKWTQLTRRRDIRISGHWSAGRMGEGISERMNS